MSKTGATLLNRPWAAPLATRLAGPPGYQEVFTDPSYAGQIVILTNPQIGNYGTSSTDNESNGPSIEGLVVREFSPIASNWRSDAGADAFLTRAGVPIVSEFSRLMLQAARGIDQNK